MSQFDMIIGYSAIKRELRQIADTLKNRDAYSKLGVSAPRGLLLHGQPGVGKSLMASAVIEASGRQAFICRKDQPNGDFVKHIKETFDKAAQNAPSIVLLDDMDKFANGDERHPDAEEYVTVQSCIDSAKGTDVFILATVNNMRCLPRSLYRAGRFDRVIEIEAPRGNDALAIVSHYLKSKKVVADVDMETISRIMDGHSCAELETVINEAGLHAGYQREEFITMDHLLEACLKIIYNVPADAEDEDSDGKLADANDERTQIVCHEAGHAVVSEILCPGSVTIVCAYNRGGFTGYYNDRSHSPIHWAKSRIIAGLGGLAANEQKYGVCDIGGRRDLEQAFSRMEDLVTSTGMCGLSLFGSRYGGDISDGLKSAQEQTTAAEVEKAYRKAKEILALNAEYFEKVSAALAQKKLLCAAEMQQLKRECRIIPVSC